MPVSRTKRYRDPLDVIWIETARRLGLSIARSSEVFAAYDGDGVLTLSTPEHLDDDDSLAQLIFHELCHALVAGEGAFEAADWGMQNVDDRDLIQEHACHRLQAALADRYGLRDFFGVTTDHRPYWDALPPDPLYPAADPAIALAREAHRRAMSDRFREPLTAALEATRRVAAVTRAFAPSESLWSHTREVHRSGFPVASDAATCGQCAWAYPSAGALRCRQSRQRGRRAVRVKVDEHACVRFEPRFDEAECGRCGACCHRGFHLVAVRAREPFAVRHPDWVERDGAGCHVPRPDGRCVALTGDGSGPAPYRCQDYTHRPRSCRDFEIGGEACLEARRRTGLSA